MLLGLRFLFGAALACLMVAGLAFALIATSRLSHNTQVSLIAPVTPAPSEIMGPERRQTSGTGGPYVAPVIVPVPDENASTPASLSSGDKSPADRKDGGPGATASIPAGPAEAEDKPAATSARDENLRLEEAKRGEPDKEAPGRSVAVDAEKIPQPPERPVQKPAPRPRVLRARTPEPPEEPPFNYFRN